MIRWAFVSVVGKITKIVKCPHDETAFHLTPDSGERIIECGAGISDSTHYVNELNDFVAFPEKPGPLWEWDWQSKTWSGPGIEIARLEKWSLIKAARDAHENGGFDTAWGRFDSDPASQTKLIGAAQLASIALAQGAPFGIEWTLQDNTSVPLDAMQMIAVGAALAAHIDAAHQRGRQLRAQIEAATTLQDLEAIQW